MDGLLSFVLPEASPDSYLRWIRWWREIEQRMIENPALADLASSESAPFVREEFADVISAAFVPELIRQVEEALQGGEDLVRPRLELRGDQLAKLVWYVSRRAEWLAQPGVAEALNIEIPPGAVELRDRVLAAARELLRASEHDRDEEGA